MWKNVGLTDVRDEVKNVRNQVIRGMLLASVFGAHGVAVWAQGIAIHDLTALVREAAHRHPLVLNAQLLADAAERDISYAQRQRYPELSVSSLTQDTKTAAALIVKQPVWAGGAIEAAEAVSQASAQVQQAGAHEQMLSVSARVVEAWQNYALASQKITIIDSGIEQLQDLVDMMARRVEAQISPRVELELAQARVIQAQIARASMIAERDLAVKRLQELVGQDVVTDGSAQAMNAWLTAIARPAPSFEPGELERAARAQPTVRRVEAEAKMALAEVKQVEASQWPSVYLQYQQGINQAITNDKRVGLAMEYTPGRGFSSRQKVQGALARAQARDVTIQTAIRDARDAMNARLQEMARTQALEKSWLPALEASESLLASYRRQFIAGRKSWQDVLGQQNDLMQARQSLADAQIRWVAAYAQLQLQLDAARQSEWLSAPAFMMWSGHAVATAALGKAQALEAPTNPERSDTQGQSQKSGEH